MCQSRHIYVLEGAKLIIVVTSGGGVGGGGTFGTGRRGM